LTKSQNFFLILIFILVVMKYTQTLNIKYTVTYFWSFSHNISKNLKGQQHLSNFSSRWGSFVGSQIQNFNIGWNNKVPK
jgi:hypothetical protein